MGEFFPFRFEVSGGLFVRLLKFSILPATPLDWNVFPILSGKITIGKFIGGGGNSKRKNLSVSDSETTIVDLRLASGLLFSFFVGMLGCLGNIDLGK